MLLLFYTNTIIFWIGLPSFNPHDGLAKNLHNHDFQYLPQEVCVAQCLESNAVTKPTMASVVQLGEREFITKTPLELCVSNCSTLNTTTAQNASSVKRVHENYSLNLICRDESSLNFVINLHTLNESVNVKNKIKETDLSSYPTAQMSSATTSSASTSSSPAEDGHDNGDVVVFVIKIHLSNETKNFFVFLSDDNFFTINKLAPNTTYNISAMAVHSSNKYSVIALEQQFQTLRRAYTPGNVTDIKVTDFAEDKDNRMYLSAMVTWKPPPDMTCHYDVICFSPESTDYDLQPLEIRNPRLLYKYQLENLTFSSVYKVGIRAMNTKNMKESELFWKTFRAPSCVQWHNYNFNICAPDAPTNLQIEQTYSNQNVYSFNISWNIPTHLPDNYTLSLTDLSPQGRREIFNISKDVHSFFIDRITIYGILYEVSLTASTVGGSATSALTDVTKTIVHVPENNQFVKLIAAIMAPIFCVAILSMTVFIVYHRRAKLKRYQERCKYFEELEKKAPIDPKDNFDFAHTLNSTNKPQPDDIHYALDTEDMTLFNDEMEIVRSQLTLHEVLGEGAFGLVKRGIYTDAALGKSYEVAVKMLKDHPTADDVRAFRREIEVMKSVEKHPNIVGLIGHCTRFSNDMMLLTEYCSFGNLLDFLRDEWRFLHDIQRRKQSFPSTILDIELPPAHVPAKGSQALCELNVCPEDAMPSPPPPPPPNHPQAAVQPPTVHNEGIFFNGDTIPEAWQNIKNNQHKSCDNTNMSNNNNCNDNDNRVDNVDTVEVNSKSNCQLAIERFKRKYNVLNRHECNRRRNSNDNNDNDSGNNGNWTSSREQVVDIGSTAPFTHMMCSSTTSNTRGSDSVATTTTHVSYNHRQVSTPPTASLTPSSTVASPATENKSYGYHGCCTNSCKCNVDVIIRNIDSSDASRDNEELDRLLQQQQSHGKHSNKTTIAIKNCDCRHQEQKQHHTNRPHRQRHTSDADENHKHKSAVENKTYFKIFNSEKHSTSYRKQHRLIAGATMSEVKATTTTTTTTTSLANDDAWHTANRVPLTAGDLLDIARQVALGMDFLSKNKVVHRDLAARNVLVAPDRTIKIADFGLSRDVYQENIYKKTGNGKLPIKWLALESLTHQVYTTKSDVWSYGILLYEIVTLGATPYPSIPTNRLLHLLKTGYRMERPKNCSQEFYDLMYSCWNGTPNNRPTFCEIIDKLKEMLNTLQQTSTCSADSPSSPLPEAAMQDENVRRRNEDIENDNELSEQESPIQQICSDDSYLKPL